MSVSLSFARIPRRLMLRFAVVAIGLSFAVGCKAESDDSKTEREQVVEARDEARVKSAEIELLELRQSVEQFYLLRREAPAGIEALVDEGILQKVERDPWGTPYRLDLEAGALVGGRSAGPDGEFGSADDLVELIPLN